MFKVLSEQLRGPLTMAFDTLQLKILRAWTNNIHANSFLSKYHKIKMGEVAMEIINCTKIRACSLKNIAPGHFTYS